MSTINHPSEFDDALMEPEPLLVDFFSTGCGPCAVVEPMLSALAELGRVRVLKVDVGRHPALAVRYGIQSVPTLIGFRAGEIVSRHVGLPSQHRLEGMVDALTQSTDCCSPLRSNPV
ncbi:MAG: thioredoxin family protein [Myxococcota bacterium]